MHKANGKAVFKYILRSFGGDEGPNFSLVPD